MGEVIKVDFRKEAKPKRSVFEVVLNRPDLIENAMNGVKGRLEGLLDYESIGTLVVDDKICTKVRFSVENFSDLQSLMNRYNNFVDDNTFAFNINGLVKIDNQYFISTYELAKNGIDLSLLDNLGIKIHSGFKSVNDNTEVDSYIKKEDYYKLTA